MTQDPNQIPIGISACILGDEVRFNGGHKLNHYIKETFGAYVRFVKVCPEVEIGLSIPRETLRLVNQAQRLDDPPSIAMISPKSNTNHTQAMKRYAKKKVKELEKDELCGFIVQKGSPSCGMERVKVYWKNGGSPRRSGRGVFTEILMQHFPNLPIEEDGRLNDPGLRENFIERVFAYRRIKLLFNQKWKIGDLVAFHSNEKLLLLAHDRSTYQKLGKLVAQAKNKDKSKLARAYEDAFLNGLNYKATRAKHTNVLQHIAGYFKKTLDGDDKKELIEIVENYRLGYIPLIVPLTLLRHYTRHFGVDYLSKQSYLRPHPAELMLKNHV